MSPWHTVLAIVGLAVITVGTRGFFLFPERELPMPAWLKQGHVTRRWPRSRRWSHPRS